jgi:hypothetical protein
MVEAANQAPGSEIFALYGFKLKTLGDWEVELNPKGSRAKGDAVFHTPKGNKVYVSWGPLQEVTKRFKSIEEHRDWGMKALKKSREVQSVSVTEEEEAVVCGHRALVTRVTASVVSGFMMRKQADRSISSVYFYCPDKSKYFIIYSLLDFPDEYGGFQKKFDSTFRSFTCHGIDASPGVATE